jgi:DNA-binding NtrC family response regulator
VDVYEERRGEVELLLSDVVLPGETGRALAGRLRRGNPELKVLLVIGYAEQMGMRDTTREECLAKPFSTAVAAEAREATAGSQGNEDGDRGSDQARLR